MSGLVWKQARAIDNMKKDIKKLSPITQDLRRLLEEWNEREGFPFRYAIDPQTLSACRAHLATLNCGVVVDDSGLSSLWMF